jgi:hypothetical protein
VHNHSDVWIVGTVAAVQRQTTWRTPQGALVRLVGLNRAVHHEFLFFLCANQFNLHMDTTAMGVLRLSEMSDTSF